MKRESQGVSVTDAKAFAEQMMKKKDRLNTIREEPAGASGGFDSERKNRYDE